MRNALLIAMLIASPAAACGFDGMFGFNHYSEAAPDQAAADAMREAAIAQARDNFLARHGMAETAATAPETTPVAVADAQTSLAASSAPK
jgi:hypothetical protein